MRWAMKPIGPLMIEHRLIERMIRIIGDEIGTMAEKRKVDTVFVDACVDFFRTYADRTHHGKEEDILFRDLERKKLSAEHKKVMDELVEEHVYARGVVGKLNEAGSRYLAGDATALEDTLNCLETLVRFYPVHIEKEDKHFFFPCLEYFSRDEQDVMLGEFWEFDRKMIHEKYQKVVEAREGKKSTP
jgi:hemerythrin-like domain-containing protein